MRCSCCCILPAIVAVVAMGLTEIKGWRPRGAVLFSKGAFEHALLATAFVSSASVKSKLHAVRTSALLQQLSQLFQRDWHK